jgi:hypothetical protein
MSGTGNLIQYRTPTALAGIGTREQTPSRLARARLTLSGLEDDSVSAMVADKAAALEVIVVWRLGNKSNPAGLPMDAGMAAGARVPRSDLGAATLRPYKAKPNAWLFQ